MLPTVKQRLILSTAALAAGLAVLAVVPALRADDGSSGLVIAQSGLGITGGYLLLVIGLLPAIVVSVLAGASGHHLAALFVFSVAIMFAGVAGGPINGFLWRSELPGAYLSLIVESGFWLGLLALAYGLTVVARPWLHRRCPPLRRLAGRAEPPKQKPFDGVGTRRTAASLLFAGLIGATLAQILIQNSDVGQVCGALIGGFLIAGLLAQMILSPPSILGILAAPLVVASAGYLYVGWLTGYSTSQQVLAAWYIGDLPGLALALPIHYASAGVVGSVLGVALGQALEDVREPRPGSASFG